MYGIYDFYHFTQTDLPISITAFAQQYFSADATLEKRETPVLQADRITIPLLLIHGEADVRLEYQQSQEFHDSLTANGKSNDLILYPGQPHFFEAPSDGLSFTSIGLQVKDSVLAFFSYQSAHAGVVENASTNVIEQNFPNPCGLSSPSSNLTTTFSFHLLKAANCSIVLLNALGETVQSYSPEFFEIGNHTLMLNVKGLPSGPYFWRLQSDAVCVTKVIIVEN